MGALFLVFAAHLLDERRAAVHLAAAAGLATAVALSGALVDATLLRQRLARDLTDSGALLDDPGLLRAQGEAGAARLATAQGGAALAEAALDERLLVDTGKDGLRGALALRLQSGLPMLRVGSATRVLPMPPELHLGFLAAMAALIALICARVLESLRQEPRCPSCGGPLRYARQAAVSEAGAVALQVAFAARRAGAEAVTADGAPVASAPGGEAAQAQDSDAALPAAPALATGPALSAIVAAHRGHSVALERGVCPRGCRGALLDLRRMRGRGLQLRRPGPLGRLWLEDATETPRATAGA